MLIELAIANFRSIRDEQRLSLVAGSGKEHTDTNTLAPPVAEGTKPLILLRSAAIYGPNAAGKSNLLKGLDTMRHIVLTSQKELANLPVAPFRFDSKCPSEPTLFEVVVLIDGVRYQYGFRATAERIHEEWLFAFPRGRSQRWFERSFSAQESEDVFTFGDKLTGDREVWRRATRPNSLFLSTAVQLNSLQLKELHQWFQGMLDVRKPWDWSEDITRSLLQGGTKNRLLAFLQAADFAITDIRSEESKREPSIQYAIDNGMTIGQLDELWRESRKLYVGHVTEKGRYVELDLDDESDGTQKMFALAGPWIEALKLGKVLFVDELHDNLHPLLVRHLTSLFHSPQTNLKGAQLIFTTHETSILSQDVFRRDQIWFCERDEHQATRLYPLSDFSPRKGIENLERSYLAGRYGALPYLKGLSKAFGE